MSNELIFAGAICSALLGIWALIEKVVKPFNDLKSRLDALEQRSDSTQTRLSKDDHSFENQEKINVMILAACSLLMKHCADSNHTGQLTAQSKIIDDFLMEKGGHI